MNHVTLIGLSGRKESGKDEFYRHLRAISPRLVVSRVAWADALKQEIANTFKVTVEDINADKNYWRQLLQAHGMARRKCQGDDYWINKTLATLHESLANSDVVVVTDCRMLNERSLIRGIRGIVVGIDRPFADTEETRHESEQIDLCDTDYVIPNTGTLEQYHHAIVRFCEFFKIPML